MLRWMLALLLLTGAAAVRAQNFTVAKLADMNVGTVYPGATAGTVTLSSNSVLSYGAPVTGLGPGTATSFQVTNTNPSSNTIRVGCAASDPTGTLTGPGGNLTTSVWTYSTNSIPLPNKGDTGTFSVGVTVGIPANLASGVYTGTFTGIAHGNGSCTGQSQNFVFTLTLNVVGPISLSKVSDLVFGDIVALGALGTVTVSPSGTVYGGGASSGPAPSTIASFTATGGLNTNYQITFTGSATAGQGSVTLNSGANSMTASLQSYVNGSATAQGTLNAAGTQTFQVGGTLTVGAAQAEGTYAGTFTVAVTYN